MRALSLVLEIIRYRSNVHLIIPQHDLQLDMAEALSDATTLYQWGTKTAIRRFCKTCGILPWYHPRSNPDGIGIKISCIDDWTDGGRQAPPTIETVHFDGLHYEESLKRSNDPKSKVQIGQMSKS